jgi:geranylgeranyl pyrophosphate synthase
MGREAVFAMERIDIPSFVNSVTRKTNKDSRTIIDEKDFYYGNILYDGLKVFRKRWDAALVTAVYGQISPNKRRGRTVATYTSLITPAIFILDDLMDESKHREGRKSFWMKHGKSETLIATTTFVNLFVEKIALVGNRNRKLKDEAMESIYVLLRGQYRDLVRNKQGVLTEEEYWTLCYEKAGAISEIGGRLAAADTGVSSEVEAIVRDEASLIGILSQVLDDILDLDDDLAHGKTSLPVILLGKTGKDPWADIRAKGVAGHIAGEVEKLCDRGIALTAEFDSNEYTLLMKDVFLCWKNFFLVLLSRQDWVELCRKMGAVGIETAFDLMFLEMKPDMSQTEVNAVFDRYMVA